MNVKDPICTRPRRFRAAACIASSKLKLYRTIYLIRWRIIMMNCGYSRFARRHGFDRHDFDRYGFGRHGFGGHGFGIMARSGRFFGPGEVRLALLSLLTEAPMHGYELMKQLEERSGGVYRASAGTVYPTLQQLEDEGLIASELREGKKVYRLTDEGKRELEEKDETVREIWRRARRWEDWRGAFDPDAS